MTANIGHMFYFGEHPWHDDCEHLSEPANLEEALTHGRLDWEVELIDLQTLERGPFTCDVPMRKAVVRRDIRAPNKGRVLGVVHPAFEPLQNRDGAEVFDAIFGKNERVYHTGGYLGNGEVVWLLAKLPKNITLAGKDIVETYILFSNSHNGTRAIDFRLTSVRVVCQNTLNLALSTRNRQKVFSRAHNGNYDRLKVEFENFFKFAIDATEMFEEQIGKLSRVKCSEKIFINYVENLFPMPKKPSSEKEREQKLYEALFQRCEGDRAGVKKRWDADAGSGLISSMGTWWGALNAATAYIDHDRETKNDRYAYLMFGQGDGIKKRAYEMALKAAV